MKFAVRLLTIIIFIGTAVNVSAQTSDIRLKSATDNRTFDLRKSRGKFVALHFLLKTECPFCIKHTQDYMAKADLLPNVEQVFIKPDSELEIRAWNTKLGKSNFPIFRDPEARLADQLKIPDGYRFHGEVVHYPATVLFDPKGKEVYRYVGKNNTDRLPFETLASKVKELSRK